MSWSQWRSERIGARNDLARAIMTRAALRQTAGDLATARELLEQADRIFHDLGTLDEPTRVEAARTALDRGVGIPLLGRKLAIKPKSPTHQARRFDVGRKISRNPA
jgi:hypothetical protein